MFLSTYYFIYFFRQILIKLLTCFYSFYPYILLFLISIRLILEFITLSIIINFLVPIIFIWFYVFIIIQGFKALYWANKNKIILPILLSLILILILSFFLDSNLTDMSFLNFNSWPIEIFEEPNQNYKNILHLQVLNNNTHQVQQSWLAEMNHRVWEWIRSQPKQTYFQPNFTTKVSIFENYIDQKIRSEGEKINFKPNWFYKDYNQFALLQKVIHQELNIQDEFFLQKEFSLQQKISLEREISPEKIVSKKNLQVISNNWLINNDNWQHLPKKENVSMHSWEFQEELIKLRSILTTNPNSRNMGFNIIQAERFMSSVLDKFLINSEFDFFRLKLLSDHDLYYYNIYLNKIKTFFFYSEKPTEIYNNMPIFDNFHQRFRASDYISNYYPYQQHWIKKAQLLLNSYHKENNIIDVHLYFLDQIEHVIKKRDYVLGKVDSFIASLNK